MAAAPGSKRSVVPRSATAGAAGRPAWVGRRPVPLTPIVGRELVAIPKRGWICVRHSP